MDGSHHDWYEGRRPECVLMANIDNATNKVVQLGIEKGKLLQSIITGENRIISCLTKGKFREKDRWRL